jgi:hypothetical protein
VLLVKSVSSEVIKCDLPERLCDLWPPAEPTLSIYLSGDRYDHLNIPEAEIMEAQSTHKDAALLRCNGILHLKDSGSWMRDAEC